MDWLAGLGQGFSNIAPAIQLMMMLQEAKAERDMRTKERGEDVAFRNRTLEQGQQQFQTEQAGARRREFTEPLARQGMFVEPGAYEGASKIPAPSLEGAGMDPLQNVGQIAGQLGQGANDAQGRLSMLRQKAAAALQTANRSGPGAVQSFEGGMAIGQAPFPNQSQSTSTSFTGVVPDQLRLRELDIYVDALNRSVTNAVSQYRAVNPYGGNPQEEQRITQEAVDRFKMMWPTIREQIMGGNAPLTGAGGGTVSSGASATGGAPVPQVPSPVPQTPGQIDLKSIYRNMIQQRRF